MPGADLLERGAAIENEQNAPDGMVQKPHVRGVFAGWRAMKDKCFGQMDERKKGKNRHLLPTKNGTGFGVCTQNKYKCIV